MYMAKEEIARKMYIAKEEMTRKSDMAKLNIYV